MDISSVTSFPTPRQDNRASTLDVDDSGAVTFNDLVKYQGAPVLEAAEPNTPQVDGFDVNRDGIVTNKDIDEKFAQNTEASLRKDLGIAAIEERRNSINAASLENKEAISTLTSVQSGEEQSIVDTSA